MFYLLLFVRFNLQALLYIVLHGPESAQKFSCTVHLNNNPSLWLKLPSGCQFAGSEWSLLSPRRGDSAHSRPTSFYPDSHRLRQLGAFLCVGYFLLSMRPFY